MGARGPPHLALCRNDPSWWLCMSWATRWAPAPNDPSAIMAPFYQYMETRNFKLPQDDLQGCSEDLRCVWRERGRASPGRLATPPGPREGAQEHCVSDHCLTSTDLWCLCLTREGKATPHLPFLNTWEPREGPELPLGGTGSDKWAVHSPLLLLHLPSTHPLTFCSSSQGVPPQAERVTRPPK